MSIIYFLTPYKPKENALGVGEHFKIDVPEYKRKLVEKWKSVEFYPSDAFVILLWQVPHPSGDRVGPLHQLHNDHQSVSFGYNDEAGEFIHWHRALIDSRHVLYLYNDVTYEIIEITQDMTPQEIQALVDNV